MNENKVLFMDESYDEGLLVSGGYVIRAVDIPLLESEWNRLKTRLFGVPESFELKSTYGTGDKNRKVLDQNGWVQRKRVPAMLEVISQLPITILVDVRIEDQLNACAQDWQLESLRWCIRRFANDGPRSWKPEDGFRLVVHDTPQKPPSLDGREISPARVDLLTKTATTAFSEVYYEMWERGEVFPNKGTRGAPLNSSGFHSKIVFGQASTTNALQVADVICGTMRKYVNYVTSQDPKLGYTVENLSTIAPQFRSISTSSGPTAVTFGFDCFGKGEKEVVKREFESLFRQSQNS